MLLRKTIREIPMTNTEELDTFAIPAFVSRVRFKNDGGFHIICAEVNPGSNIVSKETIKKIPPEWMGRGEMIVKVCTDAVILKDVPYVFIGNIATHVKYGKQFAAVDVYPDDPNDVATMIDYLKRMPNIDARRARKIVDNFSIEQIPPIMNNGGKELVSIPGITEKRAEAISAAWKKDAAVRRTYMWLLKHRVSVKLGKSILEHFGETAINIIEENPYRLMEVYGIGFEKADDIAHKILPEIPKEFRTKSFIDGFLKEKETSGHTCYPAINLSSEANAVLSKRNNENYDKYIRESFETDFSAARNYDNQIFIYRTQMLYKEIYCADYLKGMNELDSKYDVGEEISSAEAECSLALANGGEFIFDDKQREAVESAFKSKVTVITGGGGTGKSSICRAICTIANGKNMTVSLMAPTGQAAKVLSRKTGVSASTIHRGLGLIPCSKTGGIAKNPAGKEGISSSILIIDEFSMVGVDLLPCIFEGISNRVKTNIVFVGDPQQLPSISPGNNLHDIIDCKAANIIKLNTVYRQDENSYISLIADKIANGGNPKIPEGASDLFFTNVSNAEHGIDSILAVASKFHDRGELEDLQIISPMKDKVCGVHNINAAFQNRFTIHNESVFYDQRPYYVGDRVMHIKNNYEKQVYNGEIGYIEDVGLAVRNPEESDTKVVFIKVRMEDKTIIYYDIDINEIRVSWCSTVHKYQGSQTKYIIFVMMGEHQRMLTKELVYTGLTRAEKVAFIIGSESLFLASPNKSQIKSRYTHLNDFYNIMANGKEKFSINIPNDANPIVNTLGEKAYDLFNSA